MPSAVVELFSYCNWFFENASQEEAVVKWRSVSGQELVEAVYATDD